MPLSSNARTVYESLCKRARQEPNIEGWTTHAESPEVVATGLSGQDREHAFRELTSQKLVGAAREKGKFHLLDPGMGML
ncbi:MAG: hypothetical protein MUF34_22110 [Polyangiaceae bacterium]|jgi:hypothetical protein|nr:hypothetical protein [Polyangiaceae bacterium]